MDREYLERVLEEQEDREKAIRAVDDVIQAEAAAAAAAPLERQQSAELWEQEAAE